jgi:hypothetical protein
MQVGRASRKSVVLTRTRQDPNRSADRRFGAQIAANQNIVITG